MFEVSALSVPAALLRRHAIMAGLAALPLLVFGAAAVSRPSPSVPVKLVQTEGVRVIRMDSQTFRGRWSPVSDMPVTEMRAREHGWLGPGREASASASRNDGSRLVPTITYREVRDRSSLGGEEAAVGTVSGTDISTAPPSRHRLRSRPAGLDICAQHNMRKVHYGKRWRCRR